MYDANFFVFLSVRDALFACNCQFYRLQGASPNGIGQKAIPRKPGNSAREGFVSFVQKKGLNQAKGCTVTSLLIFEIKP